MNSPRDLGIEHSESVLRPASEGNTLNGPDREQCDRLIGRHVRRRSSGAGNGHDAHRHTRAERRCLLQRSDRRNERAASCRCTSESIATDEARYELAGSETRACGVRFPDRAGFGGAPTLAPKAPPKA